MYICVCMLYQNSVCNLMGQHIDLRSVLLPDQFSDPWKTEAVTNKQGQNLVLIDLILF